MSIKKYVSLNILPAFLNGLKKIFATIDDVSNVENDTNDYILNVDYSVIKFNTSEIIGQGSDDL